ncbi:hypothetical protein BT96DRAFT_947343 [Gymnopus androsaceus JB14]|uniref:CxC2-like cysteine cluster KDZ transposase-associated domain-containing protein n=1 Tax=Gymnopus androsaceus JB14 TaxID=1447944 RepID=A0A6A4GUM6_9AGAR|nr:hypothetical protein BT96DRAFT_947343 [Gymnopus androsaceus JB14]
MKRWKRESPESVAENLMTNGTRQCRLHHTHSVVDGAPKKHWMKIPLKMWNTSGPVVLHVLAENAKLQISRSEDILVQVDACYTQKHSSKARRGPPRIHPNTFFIPEAEVQAWKQLVDSVSPRKQPTKPPHKRQKVNEDSDKTDHFEKGLWVPKSVLDGCLASFTAADDACIKGSTQFFDVTANMTLLCHHDRALFTVNINTAGEGQHFVLATLTKLFEHLPPTVGVHFLKCIGYGLSDGEGAERLWHALSHLIAYGRVAGYYIRMYNLDSQFNFYSEEGLYKLGLWLHRKVLACDEKMKDSEECLRVCQHKNKGKSAVEEALRLRKSRNTIQAHVDDLCKRLADPTSEPWEMATVELELETALKSLCKAHLKVTKKEDALGVNAKRILESQNLLADTIDFAMTWRCSSDRKAPCNSVAPLKIEMECLFTLDVDNDIWLDVGIGYEEEGDDTVPPLWLCNEKVRAGIQAMNDRDRCIEEQAWLLKERSALQLWFNEEWRVVNAAIEHMSDATVEHQLSLKKRELCCLFVVWERTLVPAEEGLPEWGLSGEDLAEYRAVHVLGGGREIVEEAGYEYDVEFEAEADGLLIEHLDSLRITENYQDMQASGTSDL